MPKVQFPKYVYNKDGKDLLVKTAEQFDALDQTLWAESPAHFDADGNKIDVAEPEDFGDLIVPGVTPGTAAYPKWLYHKDGREILVNTAAQHEALPNKEEWQENKDFSEVAQANAVANGPHPGESLWDTPISDVLVMIEGESLEGLRRTRDLETQNTAYTGGRRGLLRELDELIAAAEEAIAKDKD